jgi:hypothetical protein
MTAAISGLEAMNSLFNAVVEAIVGKVADLIAGVWWQR